MSFHTRVRFAMAALVVVTVGSFGWLARRAFQSHALPVALQRLGTHASLLDRDLTASVESAGADVLALGLLPAAREAVADPVGATAARELLATTFRAELSVRSHYLQLRLLDREGTEVVRVDRAAAGEPVRTVAAGALQQKGDRPYFAAAMALAPGALYVSPIELNEERGRIEEPHVPVLRVATPLPGPGAGPAGIVILNVDMRPTFARLRADGRSGRSVYLVAESGAYLVHPDTALEFGTARAAEGEAWGEPWHRPADGAADSVETRLVDGADGRRVGLASVTNRPAGGPAVTLAVTEPEDLLLAGADELNRSVVLLGGIVVLGSVVLATLIAGSLSRPIGRMADAVRRFESSGAWSAPPSATGELAMLSHALDRAIASEREKARALEEENRIRVRAEADLEREAERLRVLSAVVQSSADAIYTHTPDGVVTSWNPGAERIYGYRSEEIVGARVEALVPETARNELHALLDRLRRGEPIRHFETVHVRKSGRPIEVSLTLSPVWSDTGELLGSSAIARDITARRELEQRFRQSVEASPNGMILVDPNGVMVLVNRETERLTGYARDELVGQPVELLVPDASRGAHPALREVFAQNPERRAMGSGRELFARRRDGSEVPVEIGLNPIVTPEGPCVLASVVDISERKEAQDELRRSNAELEQFAYVASHDLQEPLRMVASYTELLARRYRGQLDERADKYIHYAVDGAKRMQELINGLLRFSRVNTHGKAFLPTDTATLVERTLRSDLRAAIQGAGATVRVVGELPTVLADESQLTHVFQNLISNGVKFRTEGRAPLVTIAAERVGECWRFAVQDNGIGIEDEYRERVFEMFQRLHGAGEYAGSGIGLTLAKKIVERHGGRIWFESRPGEGTTFFFTLPGVSS